jgi:hypothetical protein
MEQPTTCKKSLYGAVSEAVQEYYSDTEERECYALVARGAETQRDNSDTNKKLCENRTVIV